MTLPLSDQEIALQAKLQRRAKREARRAKQREANVLRAQKMHVTRIAIPIPPAESSPKMPKFHVGCSGWFYWHWRGIFYPSNVPTNQWFSYYADQFNTVELNAPFYSWPTVNTIKTWIRQAQNRPFVYTVKVNELITHVKKLTGTKRLIQDFGYIADLLGSRMGCFLFQLPPSFHFSPARLKAILTQLDHTKRNVVEFRHRSWWDERVFEEFQKTGTIFCSCSGPRLPDQLVKTADDIYIRFHGTKQWYRHNYTDAELKTWSDRIHTSGAKHVWAYFNNDREGHAISNARQLLRQLTAAQRL